MDIDYQRKLSEKLLKMYSDNPLFNSQPKMLFTRIPTRDTVEIGGKYYTQSLLSMNVPVYNEMDLRMINNGNNAPRLRTQNQPQKKGRGRPPKSQLEDQSAEAENSEIIGGSSKSGGADNIISKAVKLFGKNLKLMGVAAGAVAVIVGGLTLFLSQVSPTMSDAEMLFLLNETRGGGSKSMKVSAAVVKTAVTGLMKSIKSVLSLPPKMFSKATLMVKDFVLKSLGLNGAGIKSIAKKGAKAVKKAATSKVGKQIIGRTLDVAVPGVAALATTAGVPPPLSILGAKLGRDAVRGLTGLGSSKFAIKMDGKQKRPETVGAGRKGLKDFGDKMKARRALVNKIMKDKGLKFKEASALVKSSKMPY